MVACDWWKSAAEDESEAAKPEQRVGSSRDESCCLNQLLVMRRCGNRRSAGVGQELQQEKWEARPTHTHKHTHH